MVFNVFLDFEGSKIHILNHTYQHTSLRVKSKLNSNVVVSCCSVPKPGAYYVYFADKEYNIISGSQIARITCDSFFSAEPKYQIVNSSREISQNFSPTNWEDLSGKIKDFISMDELESLVKTLILFQNSANFKELDMNIESYVKTNICAQKSEAVKAHV